MRCWDGFLLLWKIFNPALYNPFFFSCVVSSSRIFHESLSFSCPKAPIPQGRFLPWLSSSYSYPESHFPCPNWDNGKVVTGKKGRKCQNFLYLGFIPNSLPKSAQRESCNREKRKEAPELPAFGICPKLAALIKDLVLHLEGASPWFPPLQLF